MARLPARGLVVLAGLPGAGKSTLLREARRVDPVRVLDSADVQARWAAALPGWVAYRWYRPLVHLAHRLAILHASLGAAPVLAHEPATRASTRVLLVLIGLLTGRSRHFVWLSCPPADALAGQQNRGRVLHVRSFTRHVRRASRVERSLARHGLHGWHSVERLRRGQPGRSLLLCSADVAADPHGAQ